MGLALLLNEGDLALLAHRPWLKAGEYTVLLESQEVLSAAHREGQRLQAQAVAQADALRQEAREQGLAEGRAEAAEELAAISLRSAQVLRRLEPAIARCVMRALHEMVEDMPVQALYESALLKAAKLVRSESFLILRVPPRHEAAARHALAKMLGDGGLPGAVELSTDPSLPDHACVMESEAGVVSAGLDVQLAAIGRAVTAAVAGLAGDLTRQDDHT